MQYFVGAVFHLVQYFSSDDGHRTVLWESRRACPPSAKHVSLTAPASVFMRLEMLGGTFIPTPFSTCSWTCCS